jgi:hypothetical protein
VKNKRRVNDKEDAPREKNKQNEEKEEHNEEAEEKVFLMPWV